MNQAPANIFVLLIIDAGGRKTLRARTNEIPNVQRDVSQRFMNILRNRAHSKSRDSVEVVGGSISSQLFR